MTRFHRYRSVWEHEELLRRLSQIRHVALDMDGTIYMGSMLFPWTPGFLSGLGPAGIGHSFLTNNPSKSIADYLRRLAGMGIRATREEMYTTTLATIDYLQTHLPTARRLFLLGTPSMISEFEAVGYTPTADSAEDVPDAVVVSFDMTLEYARLCRAAWWVKQGLGSGRLRVDLRGHRARHGPPPRHHAGETRPEHAVGDPATAFAATRGDCDGRRPHLYGHRDGA